MKKLVGTTGLKITVVSTEVCPYCGKTYKRLKSHLPHCKAAANSNAPPTQHDVRAKQTLSSKQAAASPKPTPKGKKPMQTPSVTTDLQRNKSKKVSAVSSKQFQSSTPAMSTSILPSANNDKQKLADQIKMGSMPSPASISLISSPSPVFSKPKNKNLRALIEDAKSKQVSKESLERTKSVSEDLSSSAAAQAETQINPDKDPKHKYFSKQNVPKIKKAEESLSTTKNAPDSLDVNINETSARDNLWVNSEGDTDDLSLSELLMKSRSGRQSRITLQDVKTALRRGKITGQSSTTSIVSQIETAEDHSRKRRLGVSEVPAERKIDINCLLPAKAMSEKLPSSSSQHTSIPLQHDASPQLKPTSPAASLLSGHLSSQVSQAAPLLHTISTGEGLKVGQHVTGLLSASPAPTLISSPHAFLFAPPVRVETLRADEGVTKETLQLSVKKQNTAHSQVKG